jgi:hypothetical protein
MSTIKSSDEHLTLNADGASKDIKFQANGVQKASISSAGAFTSTTIDATALTGALPAIDGSSLTGTGKVLQVVEGQLTSNFSTSSTSMVDMGLSVTITPSSTSSKIQVFVNLCGAGISASDGAISLKLLRDSTGIQETTNFNYQQVAQYENYNMMKLDAPSTTSAITYKMQMRNRVASSVYVNAYSSDDCTITVMEIAG